MVIRKPGGNDRFQIGCCQFIFRSLRFDGRGRAPDKIPSPSSWTVLHVTRPSPGSPSKAHLTCPDARGRTCSATGMATRWMSAASRPSPPCCPAHPRRASQRARAPDLNTAEANAHDVRPRGGLGTCRQRAGGAAPRRRASSSPVARRTTSGRTSSRGRYTWKWSPTARATWCASWIIPRRRARTDLSPTGSTRNGWRPSSTSTSGSRRHAPGDPGRGAPGQIGFCLATMMGLSAPCSSSSASWRPSSISSGPRR